MPCIKSEVYLKIVSASTKKIFSSKIMAVNLEENIP